MLSPFSRKLKAYLTLRIINHLLFVIFIHVTQIHFYLLHILVNHTLMWELMIFPYFIKYQQSQTQSCWLNAVETKYTIHNISMKQSSIETIFTEISWAFQGTSITSWLRKVITLSEISIPANSSFGHTNQPFRHKQLKYYELHASSSKLFIIFKAI